jgi:hypothetical protein
MIKYMSAIFYLVGTMFTNIYTGETTDTLLPVERDLGKVGDRFRIVTPETLQWTALEEHGGANARTIMQGCTLDVEDQSASFHILKVLT